MNERTRGQSEKVVSVMIVILIYKNIDNRRKTHYGKEILNGKKRLSRIDIKKEEIN